jgi:hypothetical protein
VSCSNLLSLVALVSLVCVEMCKRWVSDSAYLVVEDAFLVLLCLKI